MPPVKNATARHDLKTVEIGFGGGCHWCTEAVFQALRGVSCVRQGFIQAAPPNGSWSEAVLITFEPGEIDLASLIEIHLRTHASMSAHKMRGKYRSAVYVFDEAQRAQAETALTRLQGEFDKPLVTQILSFQAFKPSEARFANYYASDPNRPFCRTYIDPKLKHLRDSFSVHMKEDSPV